MAVGDTYDIKQNGQIRYPEPTFRNPMQPSGVFDDVRSQEQKRQAQEPTGLQRNVQQALPEMRLNQFIGEPPANWQPTAVSPAERQQILNEIKATPWYAEFTQKYGEEPDFSPNADYDYIGAWKAGIRPEQDPYDNNAYHWAQSDGMRTFKSPYHETAWKGRFMDKYGINPDDPAYGINGDINKALEYAQRMGLPSSVTQQPRPERIPK